MSLKDAGYQAHTMTGGYQAHVRQAADCVEFSESLCSSPFVSFSAGKDSSAMLYLVASLVPDTRAVILTGGETRLLHSDLDQVLEWWRAQFPRLDLREILIDHVFDDGWQDAGFWEQYNTFKNEWVKYLHAAVESDGVYIGLRAQESAMRRARLRERLPGCRFAIRQYAVTRKDAKSGVYRICPLAYWTDADVMAYIHSHQIPLLSAYHSEQDRTKMRIGRTSLALGQLAELRQRDPASYNRLITRFPELRSW